MSSVLRRPSAVVRAAEPRDIAAIARIYEDAVHHGTASFEIKPPSETEMARRYAARRGGPTEPLGIVPATPA